MPQLIKKIYGAGTTWFYRFARAIVAKAQSSLMTRLFHIVFQVLKVCLIKIFKIEPPDLLFPVAFISFYIIRYHFSQIFRTSFNIISKKDFRHKFSFLTDSLKPPHPFNGQNPLSVTKVFWRCSIKKTQRNFNLKNTMSKRMKQITQINLARMILLWANYARLSFADGNMTYFNYCKWIYLHLLVTKLSNGKSNSYV